jgi:hypothetical protein
VIRISHLPWRSPADGGLAVQERNLYQSVAECRSPVGSTPASYSEGESSRPTDQLVWLCIGVTQSFSVPVCAITASGVPGGTLVSMNRFSTLCG